MDKRQEALRLRLEGETYAAIGKRLGVSRQRIQQMVAPPPAIRHAVVLAAKGRCQGCDVHVGQSGHVHHNGADKVERFNEPENLQLLCLACHRVAHGEGDLNAPHFHHNQYKTRIAIAPDVDKELRRLKREYGVQSHNKVLRRLLGLTKDGLNGQQPK